ncbi:MAG: phosphate-binding protein [Peptococcaceae bacterium BRH_c8a]|nr:MAG: phosphate-binding protein [Peptococcaceae bacterium BRH_c8a]
MKAKTFYVLLIVMSLLVTVVGCGGQPAETLTITTAGSTSVQPLSEELAKAFMEKKQNVVINVQGGGSSQGIKAAGQGVAEIGAASRHLKGTEKELGLTVYQIAVDGIGVVVNPKNDAVTELTMEQVKKIYAGEITNWKDVGGTDGEIRVVTRESGSGTRGAFEEMLMGEDTKTFDKAITQNSNGGVRTAVANDEAAIGYVSFGYINDEVKAVNIEGVEATVDNVKNGSYKISRPFNYLTKGEPQGAAKDFIDFVMNEGQEIVARDYISVK